MRDLLRRSRHFTYGFTDEKALYTGSTWGKLVGGQSYSVSSALYRSVQPAEETLRIIGLRMLARAVCPPYVRSWLWLGTSKAQTHLIRHSNYLQL